MNNVVGSLGCWRFVVKNFIMKNFMRLAMFDKHATIKLLSNYRKIFGLFAVMVKTFQVITEKSSRLSAL